MKAAERDRRLSQIECPDCGAAELETIYVSLRGPALASDLAALSCPECSGYYSTDRGRCVVCEKQLGGAEGVCHTCLEDVGGQA